LIVASSGFPAGFVDSTILILANKNINFKMKSFFASSLAGFAAAEVLNAPIPVPDIYSLTTIQYNEMLAGVLYGILDKNDEQAIETCLVDGENEAVAVYGVF
jgi:hypothetical protein